MSLASDRIKGLTRINRLIRRNPLVYGRIARLLEHWESVPIQQLASETERRLECALAQAAKSDWGRPYAGHPLSEWPIVDKDEVRQRSYTHSAFSWPYAVGQTSGTSGKPLSVRRSVYSVAFECAVIDRSLRKAGVSDVGSSYAVLRGDNIKSPNEFDPPFWRIADGGRALVMSSNHICAKTAEQYHRALMQHAPDYMIAYPTSLEGLAGHLQAQGLWLDIPVILTQAEVLGDYCRGLATEVFHATVVDEYGHAERVVKANSFTAHAYRFVPGYSSVELIPSVTDGFWEVVGTGLVNRAMPLVRYRTGDLVELPPGVDESYVRAVELGRADFVRVHGRSGDYLVSPEGVRLMGIDHIPRGLSGVIQSQVVQEGHSVTFRIVPAASFSVVDQATLLRNARKKLPSSMDVQIELVDMLERTAAGKTPYVIRRDSDGQRMDAES